MSAEMKKVLSLRIRLQESYEIASEHVKIVQILFTGTAGGDYFHGQILPGAVDTQRISPDGNGELNARYTLRGEDSQGNQCFVYIDNRAELGSDVTCPIIVTDSPALKWLMDEKLCGKMYFDGDILIIDILANGADRDTAYGNS